MKKDASSSFSSNWLIKLISNLMSSNFNISSSINLNSKSNKNFFKLGALPAKLGHDICYF